MKHSLDTHEPKPVADQQEIAAKALQLKQAGEVEPEYLERQTRSAGEGPIGGLNAHEPVMGAFDAEGQRPALERSRKVR